MRVCGLGGPEVLILAVLLFVVFGPDRTREVALTAGRFLRRLMQSEWWTDFTRMAREIRDLPNTLVRMAELEETQAELEKNLADIRGAIDVDLERDLAQDPWGIENAVAESTPPDQRGADVPPPPEAPQELEPIEADENSDSE